MENDNFEEDRMNFLDQAGRFLQQNLLMEALNLAEGRLRDYPLDVDAHVIAGDILVRVGRIDDAREILREVEEIISGISLVYVRMGAIYEKRGFLKDANNCYQKFIALNPSSEQSKEVAEKIANFNQEQKDITDNSESSAGILKPEFYTLTLADLYIKQGHFPMAAEVLKEIIKKEPTNIQARVKLDTVKAALELKSAAKEKKEEPDSVINQLSCWLQNIHRLKKDAAEK